MQKKFIKLYFLAFHVCYKCSATMLKLKCFCNWDENTLKRQAHEKLTF